MPLVSSSGSGHQLHFDSDNEGIGSVRNPIVSSVLYLTAQDLGGQTLCTDQAFSSTQLATRGWFVGPRIGRIAVFDGSLLHGVVPGRLDEDNCEGDPVEGEGGDGEQGLMANRRVTFMVAFWKDIQTQPRSDGLPGASQPFHSPEDAPLASSKEEMVGLPGRECFGPSLKPSSDHSWREAFEGKHRGQIYTEPMRGMKEVRPLVVKSVWSPLIGQEDSSKRLPAYTQCFQGF
jgi:hypothetical protein